ncbi:hypothetical protein DFH09DRAFT_1357354 [Mycena vulgaris]|nr:hypothetical protein DFH09DRAFT_1357354 [Mycena vulgaris]
MLSATNHAYLSVCLGYLATRCCCCSGSLAASSSPYSKTRESRAGQPVSKDARVDKARSDAIDRQITEDSKRCKKECKILLLGSGDSEKSTIVKQSAPSIARRSARLRGDALRVGVGRLEQGERAHATKAQAVERVVTDEHPAEFYLMDSALYLLYFVSLHIHIRLSFSPHPCPPHVCFPLFPFLHVLPRYPTLPTPPSALPAYLPFPLATYCRRSPIPTSTSTPIYASTIRNHNKELVEKWVEWPPGVKEI